MASTKEEATAEGLERLMAIWPRLLNQDDGYVAEIGKALGRMGRNVTVEDIEHGFSDVIDSHPASGWSPGPHEVVTAVRARAYARLRDTPREQSHYGKPISFAEWWETVPDDEKPRHAALRRIMERREDTIFGEGE